MLPTGPIDQATELANTRSEFVLEQRLGLPAWLLSLVLHATIFVAIGLLAPASVNPPPGEPERVVGIALVARNPSNATQYLTEGHAGTTSSATAAATSSSAQLGLPSLESLSLSSGISLPLPGDSAAAAGGSIGILNAAGLTSGGEGRGSSAVGGQTRTQVFGARGQGSSFVYVFDRSSSMGGFGGRPLAAAKAELKRSLADLVSVNQFQIVFYNERPAIFNPFHPNPPTMYFGTEENKQLAHEYVQAVTPVGGTRHLEALEFALRMAPDVIFFLTDAGEPGLTAAELAGLQRRNRSATIIHVIEFGTGLFQGGDNFLTRLARQNGGQHVYVDVTSLPAGM